MAIDRWFGHARHLGVIVASAALAGGCTSAPAASPQPVAKQPQPQLELLNRVNSMEAEISRLRNTVEIQENELTRLRDRQSQIYDDIDSRLRSIEAGGPACTRPGFSWGRRWAHSSAGC